MTHKISFKKLPLSSHAIFDIYIGFKNGKSKVNDIFFSLTEDQRDSIKDLITKMSEFEGYQSDRIKYSIKKYNYGEIRPMPHRFFFFRKCGKNYIFFDYIEKKKYSLPDNIYKRINERKTLYEKEFERQFLQGII